MAEINSLGGLLPLVNRGLSIANTIDRFQGKKDTRKQDRAENALALQQAQERRAAEEKIAADKYTREQAVLSAQGAEDERRRLSALKRASAATRAKFGGAGVTAEGGSGEAVLLGLFQESEEEKQAQDSITALRRQILDDNFSALKSRNLLELSQAAARYNLFGTI